MKRRENELKAELMKELAKIRGMLAIRREDKLRTGLPDIELHGFARTSFWEAKHLVTEVDAKKEIRGQQYLTMLKLEAAAWAAFYLVWIGEPRDGGRLLVVLPRFLGELWPPHEIFPGNQFDSVASWMASLHQPKKEHS